MGSYIERLNRTCLSLAKEDEDTTLKREKLIDPPAGACGAADDIHTPQWSQDIETQFASAAGRGTLPVQNYGQVNIRQGRIVAWPNTMHHRFSGIELEDKTRPGKMSFVQVSLVDPEQRIVSTANVPPQRADWFGEVLFQSEQDLAKIPSELLELLMERGAEVPVELLDKIRNVEGQGGNEREAKRPLLPNELVDMVRNELGDDYFEGLMTRKEAEEIRLELMEEREKFRKKMKDNLEKEKRTKWWIPGSWQAWLSLAWPRPIAP